MDKTLEQLRADLVEAEAKTLINEDLDKAEALYRAEAMALAAARAEARTEAWAENVAKIDTIRAKIKALKEQAHENNCGTKD